MPFQMFAPPGTIFLKKGRCNVSNVFENVTFIWFIFILYLDHIVPLVEAYLPYSWLIFILYLVEIAQCCPFFNMCNNYCCSTMFGSSRYNASHLAALPNNIHSSQMERQQTNQIFSLTKSSSQTIFIIYINHSRLILLIHQR